MKATGAVSAGNTPAWGLQTKQSESRPDASTFQQGWNQFYDGARDPSFSAHYEYGKPHLRTYGHGAEKFTEAFARPYVPLRPPKPPPRGTGRPGETWGVGGTLPSGTLRLEPVKHDEPPMSHKRYLCPAPAQDFFIEDTMGSKKHVYDEKSGLDRAQMRSEQSTLEDSLQSKGRVTEEMRSEKRTIHRMAPPGLKGFMGAEYSNDYFKLDGVIPRTKMRMSREDQAALALLEAAERTHARLGKPKSFKQKRAEEDLAEQVDLVGTLNLDYDILSDDEDAPPKIPTEG